MTTRLRAGVFIDSTLEDKPYYFGYVTHPGLEYDVAVAFTSKDLSGFTEMNKVVLPTDEPDYKFGMLVSIEDRAHNYAYCLKAFIAGKLRNLIIYPSQYELMLTMGNVVNNEHQHRIIDTLIES